MRTAHRLVAPAQLAGAAQTALVGDAGLRLSVGHAFAAVVAGLLPLARALVPTRRLAALAGQSAPVSSALVAGSALASPSSTLGRLAPLSAAHSYHLAHLFCTLVDGSLAPMWISVLKLCFESCLPGRRRRPCSQETFEQPCFLLC